MKRKGLLCLAMAGLLLTGCGGGTGLKAGKIDTNTLIIDKDGGAFNGIVESFEKDYYEEGELKEFLDGWIEDYNAGKGKDQVTLESFLVQDKEASMVVKYKTLEDYAAINNTEAGIVSYEEAKNQGLLPESMVNMADGSTVARENLETDAGAKVLFLVEEYDVVVDGKVLYYSNSALISGNDSVHTKGDGSAVIIYK